MFRKALAGFFVAVAVSQWSWFLVIPLSVLVFVLTGGWKFIRLCYFTLGRDLRYLLQMREVRRKYSRNATYFPLTYEKQYTNPNKTALVFEGRRWTYQQLIDYSNKIANHFSAAGYKKGDVVALFSENSLEYVGVWLGLGKLGVITALINSNLRGESLIHCLNTASAKALLFAGQLTNALEELDEELTKHLDLYCLGETAYTRTQHLQQVLENMSSPPNMSMSDVLMYIYTSGTTGLPKAVQVTNARALQIALRFSTLGGLTPDDIVYLPLPMYHVAATLVGVASALVSDCSCILKRKFSASQFWKDCVQHNVTVVQYIGEMCRYLLAQPDDSWQTQHKVRAFYGSGLKPIVWNNFKDRFRVPRILECYAATESPFGSLNIDGQVGSCGHISMIFPESKGLFQVDSSTVELKRGSDGLCIKCKPGEPGMAVAALTENDRLSYKGYVDEDQTKKKIAHNVFQHGDTAFLSGDILVCDELGYLYFKDRLGDTFRWKGENVATAEVESIIMKLINHSDAVVYGVEVPGTEGRAGMVAICDPEGKVDLKAVAAGLKKSLPSYARPVFLRICDKVDLTGTYKLTKMKLKREGFNPDIMIGTGKTRCLLYYLEQKRGEYLPLDKAMHARIMEGAIRL